MNLSCGLYVGEQYVQSNVVKAFHTIYRLGETNDISDPIVGNVTWGKYASGIVFGPTMICLFFTIWWIIILLFKCVGTEKVGFLSGHRFVHKIRSSEKKKTKLPTSYSVRLTYLVNASTMIIFSALLILVIEHSIFDVADHLSESNKAFQSILSDAKRLIHLFSEQTASLIPYGDRLVELFDDEFCSKEIIIHSTGFNIRLLENMIDDVVRGNIRIQALNEALIFLQVRSDQFQIIIEKIQLARKFPFYLSFFLSSFPILFIFGTLMSWKGSLSMKYQCFNSWCLQPLFMIMISLTWILCAFILGLAMVCADICSGGNFPGSPAGTIENILKGLNKFDNLKLSVIEIFQYYALGCSQECPFYFLASFDDDLYRSKNYTLSYLNNLKGPAISALSKACPNKDFVPIVELLEKIYFLLDDLANNTIGIIETIFYVLNCERIHSIYSTTVDISFCFYLSTGWIWIFTSLLIISICGMIMIMLRASCLSTKH